MNGQTPARAAGKEQEMDKTGHEETAMKPIPDFVKDKSRNLRTCQEALAAIWAELPDDGSTFEEGLLEALNSAFLTIAKTPSECGPKVFALIATRLRERGIS